MQLLFLCGLACLAWVGHGLKRHGHAWLAIDQARGPAAFWCATALGLAIGAALVVVGLASTETLGLRTLGLLTATLALIIPAIPTPRLTHRAAPRRSSPTPASLLAVALDLLAHEAGGTVARTGVVATAEIDIQVRVGGWLVARAESVSPERVRLVLLTGDPGQPASAEVDAAAWRERAASPLSPELQTLLAGRERATARLLERPGVRRLELGPGGSARLELELDIGQLRAWIRTPLPTASTTAGDAAIVTAHVRAMLEQLEALARPVAPEVSLTAIQGSATCPWCKEDLPAELIPALRCGGCGTAHHAACLEEAGGCTVLGCGRRAQRVRQ